MASRADAADYERPRQVALEERGNVSWRGAYREFARRFQSAISDFHCVRALSEGLSQPECDLHSLPNTVVGRVVAAAYGESLLPLLDVEGGGGDGDERERGGGGGGDDEVPGSRLGFRVMLRKRPLLQWELDADEFDVVSCDRVKRRVTLHDGQMARNGRTLTMTHRQYTLHSIFRGEERKMGECGRGGFGRRGVK